MRITRDLMKDVKEDDIQHIQIAAVDYLQKYVAAGVDDKGQVVFTAKKSRNTINVSPMVFVKRGVLKFEPCDDGKYIVALECQYGIAGVLGWLISAALIAAIFAGGKFNPYYWPLAAFLWSLMLFNQLCTPGAYLKAGIKKKMLKKLKKKKKK